MKEEVQRWRTATPEKPEVLMVGTCRKRISQLKTAFKFCIEDEFIPASLNPIIKLPAQGAPRERCLTLEELAALLREADNPRTPYHIRIAFHLAIRTGQRQSAIKALDWSHVDFVNGVIKFRDTERPDERSKKRRTNIPLDADLRAILEEAYENRDDTCTRVISWNGRPVANLYGGFKNPVINAVGGGATAVVNQIGGKIASLVGPKLGQYAAESFLVRAAQHSAKNLVVGGAAAAAYEGTHAGYGLDFGRRVSSAIDAATNPIGAVMSVGAGAFTANHAMQRSARARSMDPLIRKYESITGERVPVSVYTDNDGMHRIMDAMARIPEMADDVARLRDRSFDNLRRFTRAVTQRLVGNTTANPADVVRRGAGYEVGGRGSAGTFAERRQAIQTRFFDRYGGRKVDESVLEGVLRVYSEQAGSRPTGIHGTGVDGIFRPLVKARAQAAAGKAPPPARETLNDLEGIRKQLAEHSKLYSGDAVPSDRIKLDRGAFEARRLYSEVVEAMNQTVPRHFDRVNRIAQYFHRIEESFGMVKPWEVDEKLIGGFWESSNVLTAWRGQLRRGLPNDTEALRGHYLTRALDELADPETGLIAEKKLAKMLRSKGMLNRQIMDEVVPGLRESLWEVARMSRLIGKTFRAEGSQTFGRAAVAAGQAARAAQISSFAVGLLTNPFTGLSSALGITGIRYVMRRMAQSMVSGSTQDMMQGLARSGVAPVMARPQAAVSAAGGLPAGQRAAESVISGAGDALSGAADFATGAFRGGNRNDSSQ